MPLRPPRTLLLALVACVQLALAPAFRPRGCGSDTPGPHRCCAQPAAEIAHDSCCCSGAHDRPAPPAPPAPRPTDDDDDHDHGDRCHCHHTPQPWAPADDAAPIPPAAALVALLAPQPTGRVATAPPAHSVFDARAGPPPLVGPPLFVRHCAFLD